MIIILPISFHGICDIVNCYRLKFYNEKVFCASNSCLIVYRGCLKLFVTPWNLKKLDYKRAFMHVIYNL